MATVEDRIKDPEYHNWVKSALCLQYTRDGLVHFCDLKSQDLNQKITQALKRRGNPNPSVCPNIAFDIRRKSISCCNNCNDILLEVMNYRPGNLTLNLGNSNPKQLLHQHWQCSKLYMNVGQDVNSTTPKDSDISGLLNFIDHCSVPRGCVTNPDNLKQVRDTRNRVLHTPDMKVTNNDFQNVITPLLIDLLQDPGFLLTDPDAITAVDMINKVKGADFIITKDDEEKALLALKEAIKKMYKLTRDEMSKLDDRVDTLSKDVSSLKQDELRVLQDGLTKNDTDISEVKQMYETLRKQVEQSNDIHLELTELQEETKTMVENLKTLHGKVMDIQQALITMQRELDETRQDIVKISEEQAELKEKQAEDRQLQENLSKMVEGIRKKDEPFIPSEQDKLELQEYLREAYTSARRLDVPLLPEWGQLHVSQIFSPAILAGNKQLRSYKEIFYKNGKLQKRVVLLGEAGRGKSTFCKHLTDIWQGSTSVSQFCDIGVLKEFGYLFYVSCRFAKEKETLLDMISYQLFGGDDKMNMAKVARYVLQNLPYLCLIIVDGLDEWAGSPTSETGRMGDVAGLPGLAGVEDCIILITSRPWKINSLSPDAQKIFMRFNIEGIEDVKELSQQVLNKLGDREPVKSADEFLRQVYARKMYGLMKSPLILIIALRGWVGDNDDDDDDERVRSLHKSVCINYINMIQSLISRSKGQAGWSRSESKLSLLVPTFENLESEWGKKANKLPTILSPYKVIQKYAGLLLSVGQLAFELLLGTKEQSLVLLKKYLPEDDENDESIYACLALGIISKTETTIRDLKKLESYAFYHKTFQEFFAALWLASKYETEKNKLFECIKTSKDLLGFEMLIQFLCGFDPDIGKQMWLDVSEELEMEQWEQVQYLVCRCMKEHESSQVYFCIPHIRIYEDTSDEDIELLCHVMEEYYSNVKSVAVFDRESQQQVQNICKSISYCSGLRDVILLGFPAVSYVLDLQKLNKLETLWLGSISVESLLLPGEGATITTLELHYVRMPHHSLKQLEKLSSYTNLVTLYVERVSCSDNDSVCIPVLDLRQHNKLETLKLRRISVESLLLPMEGDTITTLELFIVTMTHYGLQQLLDYLSYRTRPQHMFLLDVKCRKHGSISSCQPLKDINKTFRRYQQHLPAE